MRFKRLQHVSINIEAGREDEARRFYGAIVGLREKPRPIGLKDRALIWYAVGDGEDEIHLIRTPGEEFSAARAGDHLCIETEDLEAVRDRLVGRGVAVREASVIDNRPRFFISDPFGNAIEIVQINGPFTPVDE